MAPAALKPEEEVRMNFLFWAQNTAREASMRVLVSVDMLE
jgi:hypothetical protein